MQNSRINIAYGLLTFELVFGHSDSGKYFSAFKCFPIGAIKSQYISKIFWIFARIKPQIFLRQNVLTQIWLKYWNL